MTTTLTLSGAQSSSASQSSASPPLSTAGSKSPETIISSSSPPTGGLVPLVGTAKPDLPKAPSGQLAIVAQGTFEADPAGFGSVPIVVQNNTGQVMHGIEAEATATDAANAIVGSGSSQGFTTSTVGAGAIAFGYAFFSEGKTTSKSKIDIKVSASEGADDFNVDLVTDKLNVAGGSILGRVTNQTKEKVNGPIAVAVACFSKAGKLLSTTGLDFAKAESLAPGATTTFSVSLRDKDCPTYLAGAQGTKY